MILKDVIMKGGMMMKRIIILLVFSIIPFLLSAEETDSFQFVKEKRINWRGNEFIDRLIEAAKLQSKDDYIFIEEYHTDFNSGLILLKQGIFYYFKDGKIIKEKLSDSILKELAEKKLNNSVKTDMRMRDKCYYNIFIKKGEVINYSLFDNSIDKIIDDEIIEKDRQTVVRILDLLGLGIYYEW